MDARVQSILDFIEKQPEPSPPLPTPEGTSQPSQPVTSQPVETKVETPAIEATSSVTPIHQDSKLYSKVNSRLRSVKNFPYLLKLPTENIIFNTQDELNAYRLRMLDDRKAYMREQRMNKITQSKMNFDKLPQVEDESQYITEDNAMYKRREPDAVVRGDKKYKVPKTNVQDTKKIYTDISKNKANLTRLAKAKDEGEFQDVTRDSLQDESVKEIYEQHKQNDINPDNTWTRDAFFRYMTRLMEEENGRKPKKPPGLPKPPQPKFLPLTRSPAIYGLNPELLRK